MATELATLASCVPPIWLHDELSEFLGFTAPGEPLAFTLMDAGKFAGHLCPTVATAFEMTRRALKTLYPGEMPPRGKIRVTIAGSPGAFANGPLAQVIGYITGAAGQTGFRGIDGRFARNNLLEFDPRALPFGSVTFTRTDNSAAVRVLAFPERLPAEPEMPVALRKSLAGDAQALPGFRAAWARRFAAVRDQADRFIEHELLQPVPARTSHDP